MATKSKITSDILAEIGKDSPVLRRKVETLVGDITVDLLNQNYGRFSRLEKTIDITLLSGDKYYKLPNDFNTVKKTFFQVDSMGEFIARCEIQAEVEVFANIADGEYTGIRLAYIKELDRDHADDGAGTYLIIASEPTETIYYRFTYYRMPTENDTDLIRSEKIIKTGVRAELPEYYEKAEYYSAIYEEKMKPNFKEGKSRRKTVNIIRPSRRIAAMNKRMYNIGQGK